MYCVKRTYENYFPYLKSLLKVSTLPLVLSGPGSSVGIATGYGPDGPGNESRWGEIFRTSPDRPWDPPSLLYNGYRVFPGGKERPGRDADPSPLLVPWSWKSRAIPLLSLWAVRPIESLSACTRVHFTFSRPYVRSPLRTTHVTTQTTQSNYMSRATQLHSHLHLARYRSCNCSERLEISTPDQHRNLINHPYMTSHHMLMLSMIFRWQLSEFQHRLIS